MSSWRTIRSTFRRLVQKDSVERELDDEVQHYLEMSTRERMRGGMSRIDAERASRLEMGGVEPMKEEVRGGGWESAAETVVRDVRYAGRALRRNPGFTTAAVLTLALGIGANTTIFSLVNAVLLRPPPHVQAPARLVAVFTSDFSGPPYGTSSYPDFEEFRKQREIFEGVSLFAPRGVGVGDAADMERTGLELISDNYFQVLGVRPQAGRFFAAEEGRAGAPVAVAVIGHDLWQRRFAGNPSVVGSTIRLNGQAFTVVGVAPEGFRGSIRGISIDVWIPVVSASLLGGDGPSDLGARGDRSYIIMARLAPGVDIARAQTGMNVVARQLHAAYPEWWTDVSKTGRRITLVPERETRVPPQMRGPALGFVALLMATVALVLLICCANVASLTLARATGRAKEIGVRLSLGASRRRIVRQLLTESVLIAFIGGGIGILFAFWATRTMMAFHPPLPIRIALDLGLDARVLLFTMGAALLTALFFGLAPALRASRPDVVGVLKGDGGSTAVAGRRIPLQSILVVSQVAMSLLLLIAALLFVRSLQAASAIDTGFTSDGMLLVDAEPRPGTERTVDPGRVAEQLQERIAAIPGVRAVSWAAAAPLGFDASRRGVAIEGYKPRDGEDMEYHYNQVGPKYFETIGITLLEGRGITPADRRGAPSVVVVNEAFARRFWPGQSALGKRISITGRGGPYVEVVGVARDSKYLSLTEAPRPFVFIPSLQEPGRITLHVRTASPPRSLLDAVQRDVNAVAPEWSLLNARTMEEQIGVSLLPQRVAGGVLTLFGIVALALAAVGLYGVVAYSVASRSREIGVRVALGARRVDVIRLVLRQGVVLVLIGLSIGVPAAWAVTRLLSGFLIGATATDLIAFGAASLMLASTALLASWIPARRAAAVDPVAALRRE
jgi:macrolide transport system ATP-binding/permease protein